MDWISDVNAWIGLATLILLEIVLGIDNLVFIAILVDRLPAAWRNKARIVGLSCALAMRLVLLASMSWVVGLTQPLFALGGWEISGRDAIMIVGGAFLLGKGTMELHERLEGTMHDESGGGAVAGAFWQAILQIVVLDAVFSLDSVITAVGMVTHLPVMMIAVVTAMGLMMLASKPLVIFVGRHPTVVILCLGFLLLIGFGLILDGFGLHVPKGYLYAAIGFSVLIELANQLGRRNRERVLATVNLREKTSAAVLRLLGGAKGDEFLSDAVDVIGDQTAAGEVFLPEEQEMVRGVLDLSERRVRSIMTPRNEVEWLDLDSPEASLKTAIRGLSHSRVVLSRGRVDDFEGIALARDLFDRLAEGTLLDWPSIIRQPLVVPESLVVLRLMDQLRQAPVQMALVVDEHGSFEGVVTPRDILEAITGGFPDEGVNEILIEKGQDGSWTAEGAIDIRRLSATIGADLLDAADRYTTLAGYLLVHLGRLPQAGEAVELKGRHFSILEMDGRAVGKVRISLASDTNSR